MSTGVCLHYEGESSNCTSGFIGFQKKQLFDYSCGCRSEIGYEDSEELFGINLKNFPLHTITEDCESSVSSDDVHSKDSVHVAMGDGGSSMEALCWTMEHAVTSSTDLHVLHVLRTKKLIPSPMGKFPRSHVSPDYVDLYLTEKKDERKLRLQRIIDLCVPSEVKVEIILVEDDNVAKAIVEHVAKLNITKLVIGTSKSNLSGSRRQNAIATQVLKNAQESCDVKIICDGKDVTDQIIGCASIRSSDSISCKSSHDEEDKRESMAAINKEHEEEDSVYVAVGTSETSMEALSWTLMNLVSPSTVVYLICVFPEIKYIPSPLGMGMIPKDQVNAKQVESYMAQERGKRRELLQKFLQSCYASKVKVDTILIESDMAAKSILDLIPILNITKLVVGTNKSNIRKSRSSKGSGIADQILQNAPESCKLSIICEGKEVTEQMMVSPSPLVTSPGANVNQNSMSPNEEQQNDSISCSCFKRMFR